MAAYTNQGKTSSAKGNSGWKPKLSERDCSTMNKIVTTTAKVTAELNIHLKDPVSTTVLQELHISNIQLYSFDE